MAFTTSQITKIVNANAFGDAVINVDFVAIDSRAILPETAPQTAFFALSTETGDGHCHVNEAYNLGVRVFILNRVLDLPDDATQIVVPDVTQALQRLAAERRKDFKKQVIAVTGSRGKTIVKEWLASALRKLNIFVSRSPRSFNSKIGVPLSILAADPEKPAIIEAGVSKAGEMDCLANIINPDVVVITALTDEHSDGFPSKSDKASEKVSLARNAKSVIFNADEPLIAHAVDRLSLPEKISISRRDPNAAFFVSALKPNPDGSAIVDYTFSPLDAPARTRSIVIPSSAPADIENALYVLALIESLNPDDAPDLSSLPPVDTRIDVMEATGDCLILRDLFTNDVPSLSTALDFMRRRATYGRKMTVILGDLEDSDYDGARDLFKRYAIDRVVAVGPHVSRFFTDEAFADVDDFLAKASPADFSSELILIEGRADKGFNRIAEMLEASQHQTLLEVNLDDLTRNYNFFKSLLKPSTGIVCMVKAFGYGAGSYELAKTLQSQGAAYLAVAAHDEGVDLRRAGITMPIMVLNPRVENYRALFAYRLEPEIYSLEILSRIIDEAKRWGLKDYPVHIKLDTGMHRLGFLFDELPQVVELLKNQDYVSVRSVFSHLCAADDPAEDDYTRAQFDYFDRCCDFLAQNLHSKNFLRHILNSTGIVRFPERQYDMVRLGIGLYGVPTLDDGSMDTLRPVSALKSVIIAVREWPEGTTIGYNRRGRLSRPSRIATVPVGYADGIDRHLGYGNLRVDVGGVLCPTVGSVCMDVMMIDITDAPNAKVGDSIEVFGPNVRAKTLSDTLTTIPYEILTSVSRRVKRVYYRE